MYRYPRGYWLVPHFNNRGNTLRNERKDTFLSQTKPGLYKLQCIRTSVVLPHLLFSSIRSPPTQAGNSSEEKCMDKSARLDHSTIQEICLIIPLPGIEMFVQSIKVLHNPVGVWSGVGTIPFDLNLCPLSRLRVGADWWSIFSKLDKWFWLFTLQTVNLSISIFIPFSWLLKHNIYFFTLKAARFIHALFE